MAGAGFMFITVMVLLLNILFSYSISSYSAALLKFLIHDYVSFILEHTKYRGFSQSPSKISSTTCFPSEGVHPCPIRWPERRPKQQEGCVLQVLARSNAVLTVHFTGKSRPATENITFPTFSAKVDDVTPTNSTIFLATAY